MIVETIAISRRPSGLRKTISSHNSLGDRKTWRRSPLTWVGGQSGTGGGRGGGGGGHTKGTPFPSHVVL